MAGTKLVNIVALATLAVLAGTYGPQPASALATHGGANHLNRADHHAIAQKQRRADKRAKRCRKRPSSLTSSAAASTSPASSSSETSASEVKTSSSASVVKTSSSSEDKPSSSTQPASTTPQATSTKVTTSAKPTSSASNNNNGGGNGNNNNNGGSNNGGSSSGGGSSGSPGPGKVGLAWPNGNSPQGFVTKEVSWIYSWSPHAPSGLGSFPGLCFIPMLWGPDQEGDFNNLAKKNANCGWVASFNEPNQAGQSNLDPYYAAEVHKRVIQPLADQGMKVLAPATSSDPRGLTWMKTFMQACTGCKFDAMGIHYYDVTFDGFKNYLELWHNTFNLPLMVTEFACQNFNGGPQSNQDQVWAFWSQSIKYMEAQDWIMSYYGFGAMREMQGVNPDNQLMKQDGTPTSLGYTYINANWQ